MDSQLLATIARVRRAMPRNADVMAVCDAAERGQVVRPKAPNGTFNKKTYMREYMRRKRANDRACNNS